MATPDPNLPAASGVPSGKSSESKGNGSTGSRSKASHAKASSKADREKMTVSESSSEGGNGTKQGGGAFQAIKTLSIVKKLSAVTMKAAVAIKGMTILQTIIAYVVAIFMTISTILAGIFASEDDTAWRDEYLEDCKVYIDKGAIGSSKHVDADILRMRNARSIYHVLTTYGLRPEQCFAVLGNFTRESSLDPTAVETVFNEPFRIGVDKQDAIALDFIMMSWKPDYAKTYPTILRAGIGLGQWTDIVGNDNRNKGRNTKLREYAHYAGHLNSTVSDDKAAQWYDLGIQLAFMLDTSSVGDTGAGWMRNFADIGSEEFKGDKESYNKYASTIYPVIGPNGEHVEDDYYRDEDRETARLEADRLTDIAEANKAFDVWVSDGVDASGRPKGHYEVDKSKYNEHWKKVYRQNLYWETTKWYTEKFLAEWEGVPGDALDERTENAKKYFNMWWNASVKGDPNLDAEEADIADAGAGKFFKIEEGYASSVLKVIDLTRDSQATMTKAYMTDFDMLNCRRYSFSTAKSIGQCAAMFAWPTRDMSVGNNGTALFQHVHDLVLEGDSVYMSCDRTVATAVRWSGFDDDYPAGPTLTQIQYLVTSPRWTELEWGGDKDQLQSGDVLIKKDSMANGANEEDEEAGDTHHTLIYVDDWTVEQYATLDGTGDDVTDGACIVEGSFGERSPGAGVWSSSFEEYHAFRCTNPMDPGESKYMGIGMIDKN